MVTYFAKELFPAVRAVVPGAEFHIIGHEAGADVRRLALLPGVVFVGSVDDQVPVLEACWLTVCPLRFGSGVQNKIIESLALGTPVVTTPNAGEALVTSEGDSPGVGSPAVIAELGSAFSEQVVDLLQDRSRRDQLGRAGRAWVTAVHRPERALAPLLSLVQRLAAAGSSPLV
jgi:glycosyltransferase involved in cell wall biosynthesis